MRKVLKRLGCSFHKVSGFLFKANQEKQKEFIEEYEQDKGQAAQEGWRRYFLDGVHPLHGLEVVFSCWLLAGQRFEVGVGGGRKRLNILGAYCPDDQEYLDRRYHGQEPERHKRDRAVHLDDGQASGDEVLPHLPG